MIMRILAIISGEYGIRHANNIEKHKPAGWSIETWKAPAAFPLIIDYPEEFLPESFEPCDLILSFAENKSVAELIPDIAGWVTNSTGGWTGWGSVAPRPNRCVP